MRFDPAALKTLRTKSGLTQHELAQRSGVNESTIRRLEQHPGEPRLRTVLNLSTALGDTSLEQLLR